MFRLIGGNPEPERSQPIQLSFRVGVRQKSLEAAADRAVALTGSSFEAMAVRDGDRPTPLADQSRVLKGRRDLADRSALYSNQFR